jgi:4'-phosphopantetheinyl transferase
MRSESTPQHDFLRASQQVFKRSGFFKPDDGETSVLVFDSSAWIHHVAAAESVLAIDERARAERFRFAQDRNVYVLAHALWRMALGVYLGMDAAHVPLVAKTATQPQLPNTGIATSLSHSGHWVAMAICKAQTVGVDIETSPSRLALDDLMKTFCSPTEMVALKPLSASARETALIQLWTRKEALLKAFGVGLIADPTLLSAMTDDPIHPPSSASHFPCCCVRNISLPAGLVGALAAPSMSMTCRLYMLELT